MSYDLYLLDLAPGADVYDALEEWEEDPPSERRVAQIREIVAGLAADGHVLNDAGTQIYNEALGMSVDISESGATVNVAYWHSGAEADRTMASVIGLVGQIQDATGWSLFDPQRDEMITDRTELIAGASDEMDRITRWADKNIRGDKRPWWKFWG